MGGAFRGKAPLLVSLGLGAPKYWSPQVTGLGQLISPETALPTLDWREAPGPQGRRDSSAESSDGLWGRGSSFRTR